MAWPSIESVWAASCGRASARIATIPLTRELVPPSFRDVWLLRESRHFLTAVLCQLTNVRECHSLYPLAPLCDNVRSSCEHPLKACALQPIGAVRLHVEEDPVRLEAALTL